MFLSHCQSVDEMGFNEGDESYSEGLDIIEQPSFTPSAMFLRSTLGWKQPLSCVNDFITRTFKIAVHYRVYVGPDKRYEFLFLFFL